MGVLRNAHREDITNFRHYLDKRNRRDLILSVSATDNNVRMWDINNLEFIITINNINRHGFTKSACILNFNNDLFIVTSNYSHSEGVGTLASGSQSHAEGGGGTVQSVYLTPSTASNSFSHAEGRGTTASGKGSHAEGLATIASGEYSHAEGGGEASAGVLNASTASGNFSHAEGCGTVASGKYSHAEGRGAEASGNYSHAQGIFTVAKGSAQTVIGKYNEIDNDNSYALIIGNGNSASLSNALTADWYGNVEATGFLKLTTRSGATYMQMCKKDDDGDGVISYQSGGDKAFLFSTKNAATSIMFINDEDATQNMSSTSWQMLAPAMQIKNNCVTIGSLVPNGVTPSHKLTVNGSALFNDTTTIADANIGTLNTTGYASFSNLISTPAFRTDTNNYLYTKSWLQVGASSDTSTYMSGSTNGVWVKSNSWLYYRSWANFTSDVKSTFVDYVTAEGGSDSWEYRVWNSGKREAWYTGTVTGSKTHVDGNVFFRTFTKTIPTSVGFTSVPKVMCSLASVPAGTSGNANDAISALAVASSTSQIRGRIFTPQSDSSSWTGIDVYIYAWQPAPTS